MRKVLRNFKRAVSIVLVLCLIFTSQAFVTFAENVENNEETTEFVESTNEETELVETSEDLVGASEDLVGASEDLVGASTASPEEKSDESEIEEPEDDTDESLETDYPEEPEEDETDYIEEPDEDPTIEESTTDTEDESSAESFDEQETMENEQNSSGGSETEETSIEEDSEETLAIEEINDEKKDKLYGATPYTVTYNQNLPSGYAVPTSKTWYTDSTSTDLSGSPIVLSGSSDMTCEDTSGNVRTLQGWNTYSSGAGSSYSFGASINTDAGFIGDTLTLYAMWSDPVAPTTGFMYWKVDGDDNNKTIHYYASPGEGRAAVVIGTDGVEHTSLGSSDREKIKYAVFEDNIAATNLKCCFENFKGLESITNLRKLDTSNVTSMRQMFNFAGVKELDLTNFDTRNVTDMYGMFSSCENLETIRVSDKFVVDQVPNNFGKFMFSGCENLVGEQGTKYTDTATPWGKSYAHIDEGSSNPGLFSGASTPPTPPTPAKTVANISVKSFNATTVATSDDFSSFSLPYMSNSESFDPNGMVITVTYDDSSTAEVTYNNTTASQFTITYNAPRVDIEYGGKSVIYNFSIVSEPNLYIYFNDNTSVKRAMRVYDSSRVSKIEDLYNYVSSGRELGFYVINATGLQDACNKYNANSTATMTLAEAMAEAQNITSVSPMTQYTFWGVTNRSKSQGGGTITPGGIYFSGGGDGGGSSSGASDPTKGPMGDLTKSLDAIRTWINEQINTSNDIPQSSLLKDDSLASYLKSSPENINRPYTNAQDENGNRGYGQWLRVPNTTTWYFFSGDLSQANGQSSGFLANGWYNLGWDGQEKWYYFDANGVMKIGWQVIGGKMYYLDSNLSFNWYGSRTTGTKVIDGISYSFTDKGELDTIGGNEYTNVYTNENSSNAAALQLVGNNNIDRSQFDSQFVNNTANFGNALPPFNTTGSLSNQEGIYIYGGELSGPNMISRSNFEPGPGVEEK